MLLVAALVVTQLAGAPPPLEGLVVDPTGAPVPGARVIVFVAGQRMAESTTGEDGTFRVFLVTTPPVTLIVARPGFASQTLILAEPSGPLRIELLPATLVESVTVGAHLDDLRLTTPASATVLGREALATAASMMLDDQLRQVPGFSLFRRSSSRVANPTTQGVTLRGLSASGASRTAVIADGVPLNDPFGGWVYWDRLPAAAIERVEIVRGGSSDLYGSDALGGAIRIESASGSGARLLLDGGSDATARGSAFGGWTWGNARLFGAAEAFTTDGFVIVAPEARGPIDTRASSRHQTGYAGLSAALPGSTRVEARGGLFNEDRGNGTPFQTNATTLRHVAGSATGNAFEGSWTARAFASSQDYDQTFSAVPADRASERPTSAQHVDSGSVGVSVEWLRAWSRAAMLIGTSYRQTDADLFERGLTPVPVPPPGELTPARQRLGAVVAQLMYTPAPRVTIGAGARGEVWQSGRRDEDESNSTGTFVPRASVAWRVSDTVSVRGAYHNAYRTPTINELYRPFRVGNTLTMANAALAHEESHGLEGSALISRGRTAVRLTSFWTRLNDTIVNVTLASTPNTILRQRQNAGRVRAAGIEIEVDARFGSELSFNASTAYIDSVFLEGAGLEGLRVPQVPEWQASAGVQGGWGRTSWALDLRVMGRQFDDDRNQFVLDGSTMVNARVAWRAHRRLEVFGAVENVFDEEQDVGRTPIRTIGLPRTARAGLRVGGW